jgi:pSer/pThr/pTyr-binding forkhead associated (FHA) protein
VDPQGAARRQIAHTLSAAYADGLLSQDTLDSRLEQVLRGGLVDPHRLVGDLYVRAARRSLKERLADTLNAGLEGVQNLFSRPLAEQPLLLGLDWSGAERELLIGRREDCDVVLSDPSVSRRHARLVFRDGHWIVQDLQSTNGTSLNGTLIGRSELRPGDELKIGAQRLQID